MKMNEQVNIVSSFRYSLGKIGDEKLAAEIWYKAGLWIDATLAESDNRLDFGTERIFPELERIVPETVKLAMSDDSENYDFYEGNEEVKAIMEIEEYESWKERD